MVAAMLGDSGFGSVRQQNGHDMDGHSEGHGGMSPYLFIRANDFYVLFEEAKINSTGAFVGALILGFVFAAIATVISLMIHAYESKALASDNVVMRVVSSILFALRQLFHYINMLLVMTMSVWLILAVVAGHVLGWMIYALVFKKRPTVTTTASHSKLVSEDI